MRTLLAALLLLAAPAAHAYQVEKDRAGAPVRWDHALVFTVYAESRDVKADDVVNAVSRAAGHWSGTAGVKIGVEQGKGEHGKPGYDANAPEGNKNEIVFVDDEWEYDDNVVATTLVTSDTQTHTILDADILVNEKAHHFAILPDSSQAGHGLADDLESTLTHEIGHAVGLAHNPDLTAATMYPSTIHGEVSKRKLSTDDIAGVQSLYGSSPGGIADPVAETSAPKTGCTSGVGGDGVLALLSLLGLLRRRASRAVRSAAAASVGLAMLALLPGTAHAERKADAELEDPALARAELRATGEVQNTRSAWREGRIYTEVTLKVERCQAGACSDTVTFEVPGGTVGRIQQQLGELVVPQAGERIDVALKRGQKGQLRPVNARALSRVTEQR